jgi:NADP-dependent 3-hydroxy acid dehydrogenase YdfG
MNKIALITGASSGIGKETAQLLAKNAFDLIITGRRKDRLEDLAKSIKDDFGVRVLTLNFDVRVFEKVKQYLGNLPKEWQKIDVLINNAGLAIGTSTIDQGEIADWDQMIDTNVKGLLYISKLIMPLMIERKKGHIINIASIAGKEVYLNGNVYCATKHAVDAISKSMRIDLLPHNIKVTNIAPGMLETEFSVVRYKGDKQKAAAVYKDMNPLLAMDIAEVILFSINRPAHVTLNDIVIMPQAQANTSHVLRNTINKQN